MHRRSTSLVLGFLLAFSLIASACVDSEGSSGSGGSASNDGPDEEVSSEPGRGVSDDSITIGYAYLDFDGLVEAGLSPAGWGDQELAFQSVVDAINEDGGINGRTIEVVYEGYSPLGTEDAEAVCLRLTEDNEVFAVLGGFLGPAEPANPCIVGRQQTTLVGGVQSSERLAEAEAPWVTDRPLRTRQTAILMDLLQQEDMLADAEVAVVTNIDAEDVRDDVIDTLADYDVEPVEDLLADAPIGEVVAEDQMWSTLAERIRSSGANTVLLVGNPSSGIRNIDSQGLDVDIWVVDQEALQNLGSTVDLETANGTLTAAPLSGQDLWDDETVVPCREAYDAANPDAQIIEPEDLTETDEDVPQGLVVACRFIKLFEAVATEAGEGLNNESFEAAIAAVGELTLPGQPFASLGPDKTDSNDSFRLVEFDASLGQDGGLEPLTEITDVSTN